MTLYEEGKIKPAVTELYPLSRGGEAIARLGARAARGKVVVGETTFLFQFVAPPPIQPRPQLPLSVKGGLASQIDWNLTIIAAFSFLLHFGLIGAMYSDWMDPVVNDDLAASLAHVVQTPSEPPPIETASSARATRPSRTKRPTRKLTRWVVIWAVVG